MGRLVYSMSVSLDGFVETPSRSLDWVLVDYWPAAETDPSATPAVLEFARNWKHKPKIVFSRTLERVGWNSRLVRDDAAE